MTYLLEVVNLLSWGEMTAITQQSCQSSVWGCAWKHDFIMKQPEQKKKNFQPLLVFVGIIFLV